MVDSIRKPSFRWVVVVLTLLVAAVVSIRVVTTDAHQQHHSSGQPARSPAAKEPTSTVGTRTSSTSSPSASSSPTTSKPNVYAAIAPGNFSSAVAGDPTLVYVPNGVAGTVEVIDPQTFKILRRFSVGSFPEHVTPSWDMKQLYVDVSASSQLVIINPRTARVTRTIHGIEHPYNLYFTPDGSKAIVVAEYYNRLDFYDPHAWTLIRSVPMPCSGPDHADFSADGSFFLISCEFDGRVLKVDARQMKVVDTIHVGGLPVDIKLSPDGSVFYVANQGTNGVSLIDARTDGILGFIVTGRGAHGFAVSRDTTKLYLSNRLAGTISVISFATRRVIATWQVGGTPDMLQVTPDGNRLWVSNRYSGTVTVISTRSGKVIAVIPVGTDPHGLTFFPQPGRYSIGHNGVYR
jgi:YVTN family beta-propeller protein